MTIIIPLHNMGEKIKKIFETLEKEVEKSDLNEVIFIDNGSTDKTLEAFSFISQDYPRIKSSIVSFKKKIQVNKAISAVCKNLIMDNVIVLKPDMILLNKLNLYKNTYKTKGNKPKSRDTKKPNTRKEPLVSVVMPVYNAEKYVGKAIDSILSQTYKRIELIIIDDNSQDSSLKIIKSFKKRFKSRITILQTPKNLNCGGDMCANLGMQKARGKYIARMDADDISLPTRIEKQVEFLEKNKRVFLVGSSAFVIDSKDKVIGEKKEPTTPDQIYASYATFHPIIHPTAMIRRIFNKKKFAYQIEYSANNDYYTFFKLICKGYIFANLPDKLLYYRIHGSNDTFVKIKQKYVNTIKIRLRMVQSFNYRPTPKDIAINLVQAIVLLTLPESVVKKLYLVAKGIIKPEESKLPLFQTLVRFNASVRG